MSILAGFVGAACCYGVMKLREIYCVRPVYAEFGRMSKLVWEYDWYFGLTDYGCTEVWKDGERTAYTFEGDWMYKLLMKDRPSQEYLK